MRQFSLLNGVKGVNGGARRSIQGRALITAVLLTGGAAVHAQVPDGNPHISRSSVFVFSLLTHFLTATPHSLRLHAPFVHLGEPLPLPLRSNRAIHSSSSCHPAASAIPRASASFCASLCRPAPSQLTTPPSRQGVHSSARCEAPNSPPPAEDKGWLFRLTSRLWGGSAKAAASVGDIKAEFWAQKWEKNEIGFHLSEVHPQVTSCGGGQLRVSVRIHLPLPRDHRPAGSARSSSSTAT